MGVEFGNSGCVVSLDPVELAPSEESRFDTSNLSPLNVTLFEYPHFALATNWKSLVIFRELLNHLIKILLLNKSLREDWRSQAQLENDLENCIANTVAQGIRFENFSELLQYAFDSLLLVTVPNLDHSEDRPLELPNMNRFDVIDLVHKTSDKVYREFYVISGNVRKHRTNTVFRELRIVLLPPLIVIVGMEQFDFLGVWHVFECIQCKDYSSRMNISLCLRSRCAVGFDELA